MSKIEFGTKVEDKSTGFMGVVTGVCDYDTGCRQYLVTPRVDKDGQMQEAHWIDASRLGVAESATKHPGGPQAKVPSTR